MKTIKQALIDEIGYPIGEGAIENKIIARELDGADNYTSEVANSKPYKGALADCLYLLLDAPNVSEAGKSLSLADRRIILDKVNSLRNEIGEPTVGKATVQRISWQSLLGRKIR